MKKWLGFLRLQGIFVLSLAVSQVTNAEPFEDRVARAKALEITAEDQRYEGALGTSLQKSMMAYVPPGSKDPTDPGKFVLLADIDAQGTAKDIEFQPQSRVAMCFAKELSPSMLATPPLTEGMQSYPVVIEMTIVP